jgi:ubiquinone/menaquinone biosynthesis C-methylase UbiE
MNINRKRDFLKEYLNIYFDSPGLALYRALEARLLSRHEYLEPVLDLGCGDGSFSSGLLSGAKIGYVYGLDISLEDAQCANSRKFYHQIIMGDIQSMGFKDGSFQTIYCNCVLEHVRKIRESILEIGRIAKQGGSFLFTVPSEKYGELLFFYSLYRKMDLSSRAEKYLRRVNQRLNHFHCYDFATWKEMLEEAGFEVTSWCYYSSSKSHKVYDLMFNSVGIGRVTLLAVHCRLARFCDKLRMGFFRKFTAAVFGRLFRKYYENDEEEAKLGGGGLFIEARKT